MIAARTVASRSLFIVLVLALAGALSATVSFGAARTPARLPTATSAATRAAVPKVADASTESCPNGMILEHATAGGIPECRIAGGPEGPGELGVAEQQRGSIYNAGSGITGPGVYAEAIRRRDALQTAADPQATRPWTPVGVPPLFADKKYNVVASVNVYIDALGFKKLTGRITDLARDPATPGRMFASAAEGGIWESRDGGDNWYSIGDNLITQSIGAIAWDPLAPAGTDTGTLIVGTGDNAQGRYNYSGHGIFITQDDGRTWTPASTQVADPSQNFRIRVSPNDPHRVFAATSKGLFRGVFQNNLSNIDFTNVALPTTPSTYPVNCAGNTTTFPACFLASNVTDVVVKAPGGHGTSAVTVDTGTDEVLANVGARFGPALYLKPDGTAANTQGLKQVPQAGLYHSATGLAGSFTWIDDSSSCLGPFQNCYPGTDHVGRVSLDSAIGSSQDHGIVYALVHDPTKETACYDDFGVPVSACQGAFHDPVLGLPTPAGNLSTVLDGMYYSNQFGAAGSWVKVMDWGQLDVQGTNSAIGGAGGQAPVGYGPGIQSSYNNWVLIDPVGANSSGVPTRLMFGLEEIWEANPSFVCEGDQKTSNWLLVTKFCEVPLANVPWIVVGRYWNACGPFTFGQGLTCNSTSLTPGSTTHPDQHASMFMPDANGTDETFYAGSDGGMFKQRSDTSHPQFDNNSWGDGISNNINVLQPYNAEISKDGTIVAGLQDNGEIKIDPATGEMAEIYGGDGTMSGIDPDNSQNILECYVYAICDVTHDGGIHWTRIDAKITQPRFDAPVQMDPLDAKHYLTGGREVKERIDGYSASPDCIPPPSHPEDPFCLNYNDADWRQIWNLGTSKQPGQANAVSSPGDGNNSSSAVDVSGANMYVGFCAQCDTFLEGVPFTNGIATNVGGAADPVKGSTSFYNSSAYEVSWHLAAMNCSNCKNTDNSPMNRLPQRYISSIRMDPNDVNTIYVTLGGYHRVWVPPLAFGESNPYVGQGHVFKSTDHGENFTDVSADLPNTPALWSVIHNGQLVVSTDIGVFISSNTDGGPYSVLGSQLPAAPVNTVRVSPGNPDLLIAATWGRGVYSYCFAGATCPADTIVPPTPLPNTARAGFLAAWLLLPLAIGLAVVSLTRRRRRLDLAAA